METTSHKCQPHKCNVCVCHCIIVTWLDFKNVFASSDITVVPIMSQDKISYKGWLETSVQEGSIYCWEESDLSIESIPMACGASGVVYKATVKSNSSFGQKQDIPSGMTVVVKTFIPPVHGNLDDFHRLFIREVSHSTLIIIAYKCFRFYKLIFGIIIIH